jgi:hypothetical protein
VLESRVRSFAHMPRASAQQANLADVVATITAKQRVHAEADSLMEGQSSIHGLRAKASHFATGEALHVPENLANHHLADLS